MVDSIEEYVVDELQEDHERNKEHSLKHMPRLIAYLDKSMRITIITPERQQVFLDGHIILFGYYIKGREVDHDIEQVDCALGVHDIDEGQVGDQLKSVSSTPDLTESCL